MDNIIAGQGNCVVTKTAKTLEGYGFTSANVIKVIKPGKPNKSWIPDSNLNSLTGIIPAQTGLYVIGKGADQDRTADFYPDGSVPGGGGGGTSYEPEAIQYFARVAAVNAILSQIEKDAYNAFILSGKEDEWLPDMISMNISWGNAAAAKLNAISTNFTETWTGINYARLGSYGGGAGAHAKAGFIPSIHFPGQFNYAFGCHVVNAVNGSKVATGATDANAGMYIAPNIDGAAYIQGHSGATSPGITGQTVDADSGPDTAKARGLYIVTRNANNDLKVFKDGILAGTNPTVETAPLPAVEFYEWAGNQNGAVNAPSNVPQAMRFKSARLTEEKAIAFSNAYSLFLQAIV